MSSNTFKLIVSIFVTVCICSCYKIEEQDSKLSVSPERASRGKEVTLSLFSSVDIPRGDVFVEFPMNDGVIVKRASRKSGKKVEVDIEIAEDTILGAHMISLITTDRVMTGEIDITPKAYKQAEFGCDTEKIAPGEEKTVRVFGLGTHFENNISYLQLDSKYKDYVKIEDLKIIDKLNAEFKIKAKKNAPLGRLELDIFTRDEIAEGSLIVDDTADNKNVLSIKPSKVARGASVNFQVTGKDTNFNADTNVNFSPNAGIAVSDVVVTSGSELSFLGEVSRSAKPGKKILYVSGPSGQQVDVMAVEVEVLTDVICYSDEYENSDDPNNPVDIDFPASFSASICEGDHDYYKLNIQSGVSIDFLVSFLQADGDLDIELWDHPYSGDTPLANSVTRTDNELVTYTAPNNDTGERILHVYGKNGAINNYEVEADIAGGSDCTDDIHEPNDFLSGATSIDMPGTAQAKICRNDDDYYKIDVTDSAGTTLYISALFSHTVADLKLQLFNEDGDLLKSADSDNDNEELVHEVAESGIYILRVYADNGEEAAYTLHLGETEIEFEGDTDTEIDTETDTENEPTCKKIGFAINPDTLSVGRYDTRLTLDAEDNPEWKSGEVDVSISDPVDNVFLKGCTVSTPWQISCNITVGLFADTESISIDVVSTSADVADRDRHRCGVLSIVKDEIAEVRAPDKGLPILNTYKGDIDVPKGDRSDFFHVLPEAKDTLIFHAHSLDRKDMDPILRLIVPDGNDWLVYEDDETPLGIDSRIAYYFDRQDDYYLEVGPKFSANHGDYKLLIYRMTHGRAMWETVEDNDTIETAQAVVPNAPIVVYGAISGQSDVDFYRVEVSQSSAIDIAARRFGPWDDSIADVELKVYNENFELVEENDLWIETPISADPRVFVSDAGVYYVEVAPEPKYSTDEETRHTGFYAINIRNSIVINEIDNRITSENPFVELLGPPNKNLNGYSLSVYDESGTLISEVVLDGEITKNTGYAYINSLESMPSGDTLVLNPGSGAVVLKKNGGVVDAVRFGVMTGNIGEEEGEEAPLGEKRSIGRGAGIDTNHNDYDFITMANITPGMPNDRTLMSPISLYGEQNSCKNLKKDGDETDIDCGGMCSKCQDGQRCNENSDCISDNCDGYTCKSEENCNDLVQNQDETDIDCGGVICSACPNGAKCNDNSDCESNECDLGHCIEQEDCDDNKKNQDETDIDCGGTVCEGCQDGKSCIENRDCASNDCYVGTCITLVGTVDVFEDWGNGYCVEFSVTNTSNLYIGDWDMLIDTKGFNNFGDIWNMSLVEENGMYRATPTKSWNKVIEPGATVEGMGYCIYNVSGDYYPAIDSLDGSDEESCHDYVKNQDETGIDCGGTICGKCRDGRGCSQNSDCLSNDCESDICLSVLVGNANVYEDWGDGYCVEFDVTNTSNSYISSWSMWLDTKGFSNFGNTWGISLNQENDMFHAVPYEDFNVTIDPMATVVGMGYCLYQVEVDYYPEILSARVE